MFDSNSVITEISSLNDFEREIYEYVLEFWPATAIEVAAHMNEKIDTLEDKKRMNSKYNYYLKKIVEKGLLISKKAGNTVIVWPVVVEKYRVVHEILKGEKYDHSLEFINYVKGKGVKKNA
jgi:hypothetical protein